MNALDSVSSLVLRKSLISCANATIVSALSSTARRLVSAVRALRLRRSSRRGQPPNALLAGSPALNEGRGSPATRPGDGDPRARMPAQRRPGVEPRRHRGVGHVVVHRVRRSTKAGGRTPATHARRVLARDVQRLRSTKAGGRTPATRAISQPPSRRPCPLNEGRGSNPGDTMRMNRQVLQDIDAQRRPGVEPRRHMTAAMGVRRESARSTKAGGRTPATPDYDRQGTYPDDGAQRRPGVDPRRHAVLLDHRRDRLLRSTKAGGRTPATLQEDDESAHVESRSTKAGGRTPATHPQARMMCCTQPGFAQRRPGVEPRRHMSLPEQFRGPSTAQRRPGVEPRRHSFAV